VTASDPANIVTEDFDRFDKIYAMSDDVIDDTRRIAKNGFEEKKLMGY
jgi:low molecular weight protein-tyrosine phosphatase